MFLLLTESITKYFNILIYSVLYNQKAKRIIGKQETITNLFSYQFESNPAHKGPDECRGFCILELGDRRNGA
jgi:hypothetical protein